MKIEKQVCSLDQAKRLKELGVDQKGIFYFHQNVVPATVWFQKRQHWWVDMSDGSMEIDVALCDFMIRSFTVAELSVMLPCYAWAVPIYQGEINPNSDVFQEVKIALSLYHPECRIENLGNPEMVWKFICGHTLAVAMADMLIFLLEGGLVAINDVNERLDS